MEVAAAHPYLAVSALVQLIGMAWALRACRKQEVEGPLPWKALLVVFWPFTAFLSLVGNVQ